MHKSSEEPADHQQLNRLKASMIHSHVLQWVLGLVLLCPLLASDMLLPKMLMLFLSKLSMITGVSVSHGDDQKLLFVCWKSWKYFK